MSTYNGNYKYELTFVTVKWPENYKDEYLEPGDFDTNITAFEGKDIVDALLNGLNKLGYINKKSYEDAGMGLTFDDVLRFIGLDDTKNGVNGDSGGFILYIKDNENKIIFEDEKGFSEWKAAFRK